MASRGALHRHRRPRAGRTLAGLLAAALLALAALAPAAASAAQAIERFSFCGTIRVTGEPEGLVLPVPFITLPPLRGMYVGPTGFTVQAPKSCAYVIPGPAQRGRHEPTIVVWSDVSVPRPYHADIYSDPEGIFGHRQAEPSDASPSGLMERTREMEAYLDAAAGTPVLEAVLKAIRAGRTTARLDRRLAVPLPMAAGMTVTTPVRYELGEFRVNAPFPDRIERLIRLGRERRHPHSPEWVPITIPAELLKR